MLNESKDDIKRECLDLIKDMRRRSVSDNITLRALQTGRMVEIQPGEFIRDEDVCECGHVTSEHRWTGMQVCESCRCEAFRQTGVGNKKAPECPMCTEPVIALRVNIAGSKYVQQWWHTLDAVKASDEMYCETNGIIESNRKTYEPVYDQEEKAFVEPFPKGSAFSKPAELKCPVCNEMFLSKRTVTRPGKSRIINYFHSGDMTPSGKDYTCQVNEFDNNMGGVDEVTEEKPRVVRPRPLDWADEVEQARADRNKPQRAPRETGEDFV